MSSSYSSSYTQTFTLTNAKYIASKVATDLKRVQRFYDVPNDALIGMYEEELVELLHKGYLQEITYGFQRNGNWIKPTLRYTSQDLASVFSIDDDPGKVRPGENVNGASFYSFLTLNGDYTNLTTAQQEAFNANLPFRRTSADSPGSEGFFSNDLVYSSGGRSLNRSSLKKLW